MNGPLRRAFVAALLASSAAAIGCAAGSHNIRPHTVPAGNLRLAVGHALAVDLRGEFVRVPPDTSGGAAADRAALWELAAAYGLSDRIDVGVRLRPIPLGGKIEAAVQILSEQQAPVSLLLAVGADSSWQPKVTTECPPGTALEGSCFYREYRILVADVPLVVAKRLTDWLTLFGSLRYAHLFIEGRDSFESDDSAYPDWVVEKSAQFPVAGWGVGLEIAYGRLRFVPQLQGAVWFAPGRAAEHYIIPAADLGVQF